MRFLLLFLFCGLSLFASIGKISALNGKIVIDRQNQILDGNLGFDLEEKDLIITDDKSKAQITLNDGTVLSLGKNSKLNINEYVYDEKDSSNSKADFKFAEGTFKSITGAIGKVAPEKFKLETKSASIGIRGTIVVGSQEKIACTHGKITVTAGGVTQFLNAGMMTNTEMGKPPTPPTKIEGNMLNEVSDTSNSEDSSTKETSNNQSSENSNTNNETNSNNQSSNSSQQNSNQSTQNTTINTSFSNVTSSVTEKVLQNTITQQVNNEVKNITATSNSSENLTYLPFYSTIATLTNKSNGEGISLEDSIIFSVLNNETIVTIATYAPIGIIDPYISLIKLSNEENEYIIYNDDSWTIANSYYNSILTQSLQPGTYKLSVLNIENNNPENNKIELYFTSTTSLNFVGSNTITTYGYSNNIQNLAYISSPSINGSHISLGNNLKFKILADSKVGTTISTEYGYFVTISDNFNSINYEKNYIENESSITNIVPDTNVFSDNIEKADGSSWGYWATAINNNDSSIDMRSVWISGNKVVPATNYKASFSGQVIGSVTNGENNGYIKLDSDNLFKATIDIGAASITDSLIKFKTNLSENLWSGTFDTSGRTNVNQQGFSSSIINNGNNINGSLSGSYFGTNGVVKSIGGSFNMTNGGLTANGVFKAGLSTIGGN